MNFGHCFHWFSYQYNIVNSDVYAEAQIQVVLEEEVPVFAAGLGDPARVVPRARDQGMKVIGTPESSTSWVDLGSWR